MKVNWIQNVDQNHGIKWDLKVSNDSVESWWIKQTPPVCFKPWIEGVRVFSVSQLGYFPNKASNGVCVKSNV